MSEDSRNPEDVLNSPSWGPATLEEFKCALRSFANERDWEQFHTPRNLVLALVGEVGELAEIFQWQGEVKAGLPSFSKEQKHHVGEELADILLYTLRLADRCDIDLAQATKDKITKNASKYPVDACRGRNAKYTAYTNNNNDTNS